MSRQEGCCAHDWRLAVRTIAPAHMRDMALGARQKGSIMTEKFLSRQEMVISCRDKVHCVATWAFGGSGLLCRDKNLYVTTGLATRWLVSCCDTIFYVATVAL